MIDYKLVKMLKDIALMMEIKGEIIYKAQSYSKAATAIKELELDVELAAKHGTLKEVPGIGKALEAKLTEYINTGTMEAYEKLKSEIPEPMLELAKISQVGPKKAKDLYEEHNIHSVDELEKAAKDGRLKTFKGFGPKSEHTVLNAIEHYRESRGLALYGAIESIVLNMLEDIRQIEGVKEAYLTGQMRRFLETISSVDILIEGPAEAVKEAKKHSAVEFLTGLELKVNVQQIKNFNPVIKLHSTTGAAGYIKKFNNILDDKGFELKDGELLKSGKKVNLKSEEELYKKAGLQYVEPELREYSEILEFAKNGALPQLVTQEDLKGMMHCHSTWSDGANTIEEMALGAKILGFEYYINCDHSKTAAYAGGLKPEDIKKQHKEIDKLNETGLGIKILKGIESDILIDGSLDYPPEILDSFDMVVTSIHSNFRIGKKEMTQRIINAIKNPHMKILGHMTGRLLLSRAEYELETDDIFQAAADYEKVIEINCSPNRLDISWENAILAKEKGVRFAINPDAHSIYEYGFLRFGVKVARKAGLETKDIINCLSFTDFCREFNIKY